MDEILDTDGEPINQERPSLLDLSELIARYSFLEIQRSLADYCTIQAAQDIVPDQRESWMRSAKVLNEDANLG